MYVQVSLAFLDFNAYLIHQPKVARTHEIRCIYQYFATNKMPFVLNMTILKTQRLPTNKLVGHGYTL